MGYRLYVVYPLIVGYKELDGRIRRRVGRVEFAAGAGEGLRDLTFLFTYETAARRAAARVRLLRLRGLSVSVEKDLGR